jgi:hypothetical protein
MYMIFSVRFGTEYEMVSHNNSDLYFISSPSISILFKVIYYSFNILIYYSQ